MSFEDNAHRTSYNWYIHPIIEIKDYNVIIDGQSFFDQPAKNNLRAYDNIRKTGTDQWDNNTSGCLLHYPYCKEYYKIIATELWKLSNKINLTYCF